MIDSINNILSNDINNNPLLTPIVGCWRKYEKFGKEPPQYMEVDVIEFNADGTGIWKRQYNSGFLKSHEDKFNYRVQERSIIFSYASFPEQYDVLEYRVVNGHLILIDGYGMPDEEMEVYNSFLPHKRKQRKFETQ